MVQNGKSCDGQPGRSDTLTTFAILFAVITPERHLATVQVQ